MIMMTKLWAKPLQLISIHFYHTFQSFIESISHIIYLRQDSVECVFENPFCYFLDFSVFGLMTSPAPPIRSFKDKRLVTQAKL